LAGLVVVNCFCCGPTTRISNSQWTDRDMVRARKVRRSAFSAYAQAYLQDTQCAHTQKQIFLARSRLSHREFLIPFLARLSPKPLPIPVDAALCSHCPGPMIRRRRVPISFRYPSKKKSPRPVFSSTLPPLHRPLSFDPLSRTHPFPIPPQIPPPAPNSGCL
jgi:hypothetical protein